MASKAPKHFLEAHRLICGRDKLQRKSHGKAEYNHLAELRSIFEDKNIVGLGVAEKLTKGKKTGELTLCFYVKKKKAKKRLGSHKIIPPVISIGGRKPIFTDVYELGGRFKALANFQKTPIQSGFSVGNDESVDAGTVGAIVSFNGTHFILSNAHVLASQGVGDIDITQTTYPAREDINQTFSVGVLKHIVTFNSSGNSADAALAQINGGLNINPSISGAKPPYTVVDPADQMKVIGRGRTTSTIRGVVRDLHFSGPVEMPGDMGTIKFVDQVVCVGDVEGGDSGAIIVAKDTEQIVGLLFAGTDTEFLFTPIKAVRKSLDVNFQFINPPPTGLAGQLLV